MQTLAHTETVAYKEWIATMEERFGADQISLREVGKLGWTNLSATEDGTPVLKPSTSNLHYVDASPRFREHRLNGKLFGTFYFNTDSGKIFFEK